MNNSVANIKISVPVVYREFRAASVSILFDLGCFERAIDSLQNEQPSSLSSCSQSSSISKAILRFIVKGMRYFATFMFNDQNQFNYLYVRS